jgi:hypothetical protein
MDNEMEKSEGQVDPRVPYLGLLVPHGDQRDEVLDDPEQHHGPDEHQSALKRPVFEAAEEFYEFIHLVQRCLFNIGDFATTKKPRRRRGLKFFEKA